MEVVESSVRNNITESCEAVCIFILNQNKTKFLFRLVAELDGLGYIVVETQSFTNEVTAALTKLKNQDTRIILGKASLFYLLISI